MHLCMLSIISTPRSNHYRSSVKYSMLMSFWATVWITFTHGSYYRDYYPGAQSSSSVIAFEMPISNYRLVVDNSVWSVWSVLCFGHYWRSLASTLFNTSSPGWDGRCFADGISKFSQIISFVFRLKSYWSFFLKVQLTTRRYWFRYGLAQKRRHAATYINVDPV